MRAMILAAGRGKRMGQLTDQYPKPLLRVSEYYLIEYAIYNLKRAGIEDVVINVSYQGEQIKNVIGNGQRYGLHIVYSTEEQALETGGGIVKALPLLGAEPFLVMSSDIVTDYSIKQLMQRTTQDAHLVMVPNPAFHPKGDFGLKGNEIDMMVKPTLTFANIGLYHPAFFTDCRVEYFPLSTLLVPAILRGKVTGERYDGMWFNIGMPEDLAMINERAREDSNLRPLVSETNTLSN